MDAEEAGVNPARSRHCHRGAILTTATVSAIGRPRGALIREPGDSGHRTVSPGRGPRVRTHDSMLLCALSLSAPPHAGSLARCRPGLGLLADSSLRRSRRASIRSPVSARWRLASSPRATSRDDAAGCCSWPASAVPLTARRLRRRAADPWLLGRDRADRRTDLGRRRRAQPVVARRTCLPTG